MILAAPCECVREDRAGLLSVLHSVLFQLGSLGTAGREPGGKISTTHMTERQTVKMTMHYSIPTGTNPWKQNPKVQILNHSLENVLNDKIHPSVITIIIRHLQSVEAMTSFKLDILKKRVIWQLVETHCFTDVSVFCLCIDILQTQSSAYVRLSG